MADFTRLVARPQDVVNVKKEANSNIYQRINQNVFNAKGYIFDIFTSNLDRVILETLENESKKLGEITSRIRFGVVISKNFDIVVSDIKEGPEWKPFLEGTEISQYQINYKNRFLNYRKELLHRSRTPDLFEAPKIMIQRITGGNTPLKAVLDENHFYNKESIINIIINDSSFSYKYVLALLNSTLINWFYKKKFTNASKLTVNLSKEYLSEIPIKKCTKEQQEIISFIVDMITFMFSNREYFNDSINNLLSQVLDAYLFELYFSKHMHEKEINIIKYLERDIIELLKEKDFKSIPDIKKEQIIEQLYRKWTHPDNEVRNRIKLFAVRSPDILKPILESK